MLVGVIVILVVVFAPKGIGGLWHGLVNRIAKPAPNAVDVKEGEDRP